MTYDINAALERLEKNLSDVESAKLQVEETIATSESLQQIIGKYSESLQTLNSEISLYVDAVKNFHSLKTSQLDSAIVKIMATCEDVISEFKADTKDTTKKFNKECAESVKSFGEENLRLAEHINQLNQFSLTLSHEINKVKEIKKKWDEIAEVLKNTQDEQDKSLANILSSLSALSLSIQSQNDSIYALINTKANDLINKSNDLNSGVALTNQKIIDLLNIILEKTNSNSNNIRADIKNLKKVIEINHNATRSTLITNIWIFVGIVILLIVFFFCF